MYSYVLKENSYAGYFVGKVQIEDGSLIFTDAPKPILVIGQSGLYSKDGHLHALDEDNNETIISPHKFPLVKPSNDMAWSFYSKNERLKKQVNVDMMRAVELIEELSGEKLIHLANLEGELIETKEENKSLVEKVEEQEKDISELKQEIEAIKAMLNKDKK